ncbi:MAG: ABC transporter substrate-binding protein [Burkholderiales bacterium]|nr:ABC transporter substrate-binding protein [Burkholderiales bacterium]MCC7112997.1 ABC transporter substrate-binding protein [Burkholderiales bacterium]
MRCTCNDHDPVGKPNDPDRKPWLDCKVHGDGIDDPDLVIEYDPLFARAFGPTVSRRGLLKAFGAFAAGGLAHSAPSFAQEKKFDPVVKIGYLPITDASALLVAHEMGFFKKEGLDSVPPTLVRGWSPLVEAFSSHRTNLTHMLIPIPVWMRYNNKFPIKIVAWNHTNGSGIIVHKDAGINAPKDLGGKQFAVPYWYSIHNIISQRILRDAGIKPVIRPQDAKLAPDECNFVVLNPPDMPPALSARSIDGYCVAEPFNALGELRASGKMLRMTGDVWKGHPCCVVVMHEADTTDPARAQWAQSVTNAIVAAQIHLHENRAAMAEMLSRDGKNYLPFPKEVVQRAMMLYTVPYPGNADAIKNQDWGMDRINFQGWPYRSATELVVSELKKTQITGDAAFLANLDPKFVADDLVNYAFIRKSLDANPKWKNDNSVPKTGDPYTRSETVRT